MNGSAKSGKSNVGEMIEEAFPDQEMTLWNFRKGYGISRKATRKLDKGGEM
ncbi:MAG: hypothetical protein KDA78_03595 [Planctomycetaceae bacterium]|nr:hypothetical protein [Planctomycetaceae bacterium]